MLLPKRADNRSDSWTTRGASASRSGNGDLDAVIDGETLSSPEEVSIPTPARRSRTRVSDFTHTAPECHSRPARRRHISPRRSPPAVTPANSMQKEEGIADVALSGSIRADEDVSGPSLRVASWKFLNRLRWRTRSRCATPRGRQWPLHSLPASFWSSSPKPGRVTDRVGATPRA